jgi:hypothetical protein
MSCYQVTQRHLAYLVGVGQALHAQGKHAYIGNVSPFDGEEAFAALSQANAASVAYRYSEQTEPVPVPEGGLTVPRVSLVTLRDIAAAIKALDCFAYQSCEVADWPLTNVGRWCARAQRDLCHMLPGFAAAYGDAEWSR